MSADEQALLLGLPDFCNSFLARAPHLPAVPDTAPDAPRCPRTSDLPCTASTPPLDEANYTVTAPQTLMKEKLAEARGAAAQVNPFNNRLVKPRFKG